MLRCSTKANKYISEISTRADLPSIAIVKQEAFVKVDFTLGCTGISKKETSRKSAVLNESGPLSTDDLFKPHSVQSKTNEETFAEERSRFKERGLKTYVNRVDLVTKKMNFSRF